MVATLFDGSLACVTASSMAISGGNLTATSGFVGPPQKAARAIPPKLSATFLAYAEFTIDAAGASGNDVVNLEFSAQVVAAAVDLSAKLAWFSVDGVNWNGGTGSPTGGTGGYSFSTAGPYLVAASCFQNENPVTVNFGNVITAFTPPSGFAVWGADAFNPSQTSSQLTIGTDGVSAYPDTGNSSWASAFSAAAHASGKTYFEVHLTQSTNNGFIFGLGNSSGNTGNFAGSDGNSWGLQVTGDVWELSGGSGAPNWTGVPSVENVSTWAQGFLYASDGTANGGTLQPWTTGDVIGLAYNPVTHLIWWRKNAGSWNNNPADSPTTGVGGIAVPIGAARLSFSSLVSGSAVTLNTGASSFSFGPPVAYQAWDGGPIVTGARNQVQIICVT